MRVIIDIPTPILNGMAGIFVMSNPEDSEEILALMEKCQGIDEIVLEADEKDMAQIRMAIAAMVMAQVCSYDKQGTTRNTEAVS